MIIDCDRFWTHLGSAVYRLRGLPRVSNDPPPVGKSLERTIGRVEPDPRAEASVGGVDPIPREGGAP